MVRHSKYIILLVSLIGVLFSCGKNTKNEDRISHDFDKIKEKGELTILTVSSSTSYFLYREQPMGFHYDIAKEFCKAHNLTLNVKVAKNAQHLVQMLNNGEGELVAYSLPILNELKDSLIYCGVDAISHQVLVQRTGKDVLKDVTELVGKEVTVKQGSKYYQRLENLNSELGGGIEINTSIADSLTTEDLIEMVAKEEIDYTLADEYIAKLNKTYFRNINIDLSVSFDQRSSWAVGKEFAQLADTLDAWYSENKKEPVYRSISKKYFEMSKQPFIEELDYFKNLPKGQISPYDDLFKKHAKDTPFDWQILAAISFQESRFKNGLTSWAGATGIMGIMPGTAETQGISVSDLDDPDVSIGLAVKLILALNRILSDIEDPNERLKFILAAYNGGIGHVKDVRALAEKYGDNNSLWDEHVRNWIAKKQDPKYYNDPVCKSGYFRGAETLHYVDRVLHTAELFKSKN